MKTPLSLLTAVLAAAALSGCGNMNSVLAQRYETVEQYHVFDFKTKASPEVIIKGAADGLARNTNSVVQNRPLQLGAKVPETPGRFTLVDPMDALKGTGMAAMLAMSNGAGNSMLRVAKCDGAVWNSRANRSVAGSDSLTLYSCLYRYQSGYELDMYVVFKKVSGGLSGLARDATAGVIGTPEQWVNKTIVDTVRSIEIATASKMTYVEGQPALGDLPQVDQFDAPPSRTTATGK